MQKWQYVNLRWTIAGSYLNPTENVGTEAISVWLKREFPEVKNPKLEIYEKSRTLRIYHLDGQDVSVGCAFVQYLGSMGWEAIQLGSDTRDGSGWFKRPIPQSVGDIEEAAS